MRGNGKYQPIFTSYPLMLNLYSRRQIHMHHYLSGVGLIGACLFPMILSAYKGEIETIPL